MGISDKDYADALIEKHMKAHKEQLKLTLSQTDLQTNYKTLEYAIKSARDAGFAKVGLRPLTEQDIQGEAMKAPLSSLVDMWLMRWSDTWVSESDFQDDDFWRVALIRLMGANKVEKHHLADRIGAVYRIIE
jgi:hypothetical protein